MLFFTFFIIKNLLTRIFFAIKIAKMENYLRPCLNFKSFGCSEFEYCFEQATFIRFFIHKTLTAKYQEIISAVKL